MSSIKTKNLTSKDRSLTALVREMLNIPRGIVGGFSRFIRPHGITTARRNHISTAPYETFLSVLEHQNGQMHPFFYACSLTDALRMAEEERKFVFVYIHSPEDPYVSGFCRETLCSELVVQFLDANYVSWGGVIDREEGMQVVEMLRPLSFPLCAVFASSGGARNVAVLQQIEGPTSPGELVEILQRTMEDQGPAFGYRTTTKEKEKRRLEDKKIIQDRQIREEQDLAYFAALKLDKEKEKQTEAKMYKSSDGPSKAMFNEKLKQHSTHDKLSTHKAKEDSFTTKQQTQQHKGEVRWPKDHQTTQVLIRFPNGERKEKSFSSTDKIQSICKYIDSLGMQGKYKLVTSFPRRVYGVDQMSMSLKDAGLHPKSTLFLEPM